MRVRAALAALAAAVFAGAAGILVPAAPARAQCPDAPGAVDPRAIDLANEGDQRRAVDLDAAIALYEQAAKLAPGEPRIAWKLALARVKKEQWAEARPALEATIRLDPGNARAHGELGWALLHLDDEAGALRSWTTAIAKAPADTTYYLPLADLYRRLLMPDREEQVLRQSLAFAAPDDRNLAVLHAALGDARRARRDAAGAVAEYEAARALCGAIGCHTLRELPFGLGAAYAELSPPRKSEALQQLQTFFKTVCKGALAGRYAAQCAETSAIARRLGGTLM